LDVLDSSVCGKPYLGSYEIPVALFGPFWTVVQSKTCSTWENSRLAASHVWKGPELGFGLDIVFVIGFLPFS